MKTRKKSKLLSRKAGYSHAELAPIRKAKSGWFLFESVSGDSILFYRRKDGTGEVFDDGKWRPFGQNMWSMHSINDLYLGPL